MARTRNIKPAFFDNDILGALPPLTRLLFIGLWCIADREGRLEDRPRRIKKIILGYDNLTGDEADAMLQQLHDNGFIVRYKAADGTRYIQVINFTKHQNPHMREKDSVIPPPSAAAEKAGAAKRQKANRAKKQTESGAADDDLDALFDDFWAVYPKKKAKAAALRAWKKLRPDAELYQKIIDAVTTAKNSLDWLKDGGQYIPYPATWLNGRRWEDEPTVERPQQAQAKSGGRVDTFGVINDIIAEEESS